MTDRFVTHATFLIERKYNVSAEKVFAAFATSAAKAHWFGADDDGTPAQGLHTDFRTGGRESWSVATPDGSVYKYEAVFQDIVSAARIVSTYNMWRNDDLISVSVASVELKPEDGATHLTYTEHGAYIDGKDTPAAREHGTRDMLERALATYLEKDRSAVSATSPGA